MASHECRRIPADLQDMSSEPTTNNMANIPAPVRASLDYVFCYAMDPRTPYVRIDKVYIYGKEPYDQLDKSEDSKGWPLSHTNWYIDGILYVYNRSIPPHEKYGPYSMTDIFNLPRMPSLPIYRIMEIIDNGYTDLSDLDPVKYWTVRNDEMYPKCVFDLPGCVIQSAKFVNNHFQKELEDCQGIIILPANIQHYGWRHDRVRHVKRDSFNITMVDVDSGAWFLLQPCRTRFFEDPGTLPGIYFTRIIYPSSIYEENLHTGLKRPF